MRDATPALSRRRLFEIIGASVGGAAAYQAMTRLGHAEESPYRGPIKLDGDPKGASVVILGAGLAGMTAAIELEKAGYSVSVLEYNARPGGRNWTLRGGDVYTELGGATQRCEFDAGLYLNPGPWRIPYHHYAILDYCRRFGVDARALHPAQSQRLFAFRQCVRGQAAAHPRHQGRFRRRRRRAPWPRRRRKGRSTTRCRRRIRQSCSRRCGRWARSTRTSATGPARIQRLIGATRSTPEAVSARSRSRASRSGCTIF